MYHLITELRSHRRLGHVQLSHGVPVETLEEAVEECRKQMRDNFADPLELQNEDRSTYLDKAALMAEVNKEK